MHGERGRDLLFETSSRQSWLWAVFDDRGGVPPGLSETISIVLTPYSDDSCLRNCCRLILAHISFHLKNAFSVFQLLAHDAMGVFFV